MPQSDRPNRTQQPSSPSSPPSPSISPAQSAQQKKSSGHLPVIRKPRRTCQTRLPVLPLCARQSGVLRLSLPPPAALNGNRTIFFFFPFFFFLLCPRISGYVRASYCPKYSQNATHCTIYHEQNGCCVTTTCVSLCLCGCYIPF